jgi:proteic killer suppression protein
MIKSFVHKGLRDFFESGSLAGIQAKHAPKLRVILAYLNEAETIADMDLPSLRLHSLKGSKKGLWAVSVSGNWRMTFRFEDGHAYVVDYLDYH